MIKAIPASVTAFIVEHLPGIRYGRLTIDFIIINGELARIDKAIVQQTKTDK